MRPTKPGLALLVLLLSAWASIRPSYAGVGPLKGRFVLGGTGSAEVEIREIPLGDELVSRSGIYLKLRPTIGYFLTNWVMIHGALRVGMGFGRLYEGGATRSPGEIGAELGALFFLGLGRLNLYAGGLLESAVLLTVGKETSRADDEGQVRAGLHLRPVFPLGVLIRLNRSLALDIGMRFEFQGWKGNLEGKGRSLPVGFLGLKGFL